MIGVGNWVRFKSGGGPTLVVDNTEPDWSQPAGDAVRLSRRLTCAFDTNLQGGRRRDAVQECAIDAAAVEVVPAPIRRPREGA